MSDETSRPKPEQDSKEILHLEPPEGYVLFPGFKCGVGAVWGRDESMFRRSMQDWPDDELKPRKPTQDAIDRLKLQNLKSKS